MIALFSRSIYPRKGGSASVTESLAKCFKRDELCVIGGRKLFERPLPRAKTDVEVLTLGSELNVRGRGDRFFELLRWLLFPWLLRKAFKFCAARRCRTIVATFPDEFFLLLALNVAKRLQVPFFVYLHNTLVENRSGWRLKLALSIQERVFRHATKVLVISDGMRRHYTSTYPGVDFCTVPHMFDQYPQDDRAATSSSLDKKQVVLCGNFNESNVDATARLVRALGPRPEFEISIYTHVPRALLKLRGVDVALVKRVEYLADKDFASRLAEADVVVLTHGLTGGLGEVEYRTIFPTRTIPLLLTRKPLLVHAPRDSFLAEFVREHRCGLLVDEASEAQLLDAARALTMDQALADRYVTAASRTVAMFHGPNVKKKFLEVIGEGSSAERSTAADSAQRVVAQSTMCDQQL